MCDIIWNILFDLCIYSETAYLHNQQFHVNYQILHYLDYSLKCKYNSSNKSLIINQNSKFYEVNFNILKLSVNS